MKKDSKFVRATIIAIALIALPCVGMCHQKDEEQKEYRDAKIGGIKNGAQSNDRAVYDRLVLWDSRLNTLRKVLIEELFRKENITPEEAIAILDGLLVSLPSQKASYWWMKIPCHFPIMWTLLLKE